MSNRVTEIVMQALIQNRLTPNIIRYARLRAAEEDWKHTFVRIVAGGNPNLISAVRELALESMEDEHDSGVHKKVRVRKHDGAVSRRARRTHRSGSRRRNAAGTAKPARRSTARRRGTGYSSVSRK